MKTPGCDRAWQAEAIEDGRLSAADAAAFMRHAAHCEHCARELRALKELRAVAARLPLLESTPLERRRQRNELLRRANELTLNGPRHLLRPLVVAFGACTVMALAMWLWPVARTTPPRLAASGGVPSFQVVASRNATWQTLERGTTLRLSAQQGRLEIAVDKLRRGQRFLLVLPDGELEVKGTRFSVDIGDEGTEQVRVSEGRVALRLRGQAERLLSAGQDWVLDAASVNSTEAAPARARDRLETPAASLPGPGSAHAPHRPAPRLHAVNDAGTRSAATQAQESVAEPATGAAGPSFASAMSAFTAGDYARADALFSSFEHEHPDDTRVEDALFLRAVAHARRGDPDASRALARSYLQRFPDGLRRAQAQRMAASP